MEINEQNSENKAPATGCWGAGASAIVGIIIVTGDFLSRKESEIGASALPLLVIISALAFAPLGFLAGRIAGAILSKSESGKTQKRPKHKT